MGEVNKEPKTFRYRNETFQFELMPFLLMNVSAIFQQMVDKFLCRLEFFEVYINVIVIFSTTKEHYFDHID